MVPMFGFVTKLLMSWQSTKYHFTVTDECIIVRVFYMVDFPNNVLAQAEP